MICNCCGKNKNVKNFVRGRICKKCLHSLKTIITTKEIHKKLIQIKYKKDFKSISEVLNFLLKKGK